MVSEKIGFILFILGSVVILASFFLAHFKALEDPKVDKTMMWLKLCIFIYPKFIIAGIIGYVILVIGLRLVD